MGNKHSPLSSSARQPVPRLDTRANFSANQRWANLIRRLYAADPGLNHMHRTWLNMATLTAIFVTGFLVAYAFGVPGQTGVLSGGMYAIASALSMFSYRRREILARGAIVYVATFLSGLIALGLALLAIHWVSLLTTAVVFSLCVWIMRFDVWGPAASPAVMNGYLLTTAGCSVATQPVNQFLLMHGIGLAVVMAMTVTRLLLAPHNPNRDIRRIRNSQLALRQVYALAAVQLLEHNQPRDIRNTRRIARRFHQATMISDALLESQNSLPAQHAERLHRALFDIDLAIAALNPVLLRLAKAQSPYLPGNAETQPVSYSAWPVTQAPAPSAKTHPITQSNLPPTAQTAIQNLLAREVELLQALGVEPGDGLDWTLECLGLLKNEIGRAQAAGVPAHITNIAHRFVLHVGRLATCIMQANVPDLAQTVPLAPELTVRLKREGFHAGISGQDGTPLKATNLADAAARQKRLGPVKIRMNSRATIQAFVAVTIASLVGSVLDQHNFTWAAVAAWVVLRGTVSMGDRLRKTWWRVVGTAVGAGLGAGSAALLGSSYPWMNVAFVIVALAVGVAFTDVSYAIFTAGFTMALVELSVYTHGLELGLLFLLRVAENGLGAVIGVVVASAILPVYSRDSLVAGLRAMNRAVEILLRDLQEHCAGYKAVRLRIDVRQLELAADQMRDLASTQLNTALSARRVADWAGLINQLNSLVVNAGRLAAISDGDLRLPPAGQAALAEVVDRIIRQLPQIPRAVAGGSPGGKWVAAAADLDALAEAYATDTGEYGPNTHTPQPDLAAAASAAGASAAASAAGASAAAGTGGGAVGNKEEAGSVTDAVTIGADVEEMLDQLAFLDESLGNIYREVSS